MKSNYVYVTPRRELSKGVFAHIGYKEASYFKVANPDPFQVYIPRCTVLIAEDYKSIGRVYLN